VLVESWLCPGGVGSPACLGRIILLAILPRHTPADRQAVGGRDRNVFVKRMASSINSCYCPFLWHKRGIRYDGLRSRVRQSATVAGAARGGLQGFGWSVSDLTQPECCRILLFAFNSQPCCRLPFCDSNHACTVVFLEVSSVRYPIRRQPSSLLCSRCQEYLPLGSLSQGIRCCRVISSGTFSITTCCPYRILRMPHVLPQRIGLERTLPRPLERARQILR
jgi:hypothetical protein